MIFDVAVIGAGVVGALTARELTRRGASVCLLEKGGDVALGASRANSGIVHAGFDAPEGSLKARLNVAGAAMMERVAGELGVKYRRNGSLVVAYTDGQQAELEALRRRGQANGVKRLEVIGRERLRELEPAVSPEAAGALYAPDGGIVCPYELTIAAAGNAMDNGAALRLEFGVDALDDAGGHWVIGAGGQAVRARYVVNAAGLGAEGIARLAGDDSFTVRARRGEYLLLDKAAGALVRHTLFGVPDERGKGVLVSPTVDGNLLLGPTSEFVKDGTNAATTAAGLEWVRADALRRAPGLPMNQVITAFSGLRAVGDTGDFILSMPRVRFLNLAGIESPGLSAAPAIAERAAELLGESGLRFPGNPAFRPERRPAHWFRELTAAEKNEVIRRDGRYGRVVCRCETVTEGEIVEAIREHPGARDTDGVKRRTRGGMGRCQGGFCQPQVMEILARERGVPIEDVTKAGGASRIAVGLTKGGSRHE